MFVLNAALLHNAQCVEREVGILPNANSGQTHILNPCQMVLMSMKSMTTSYS